MFLRLFSVLASMAVALASLPLRATAGPALLYDATTGQVLYAEDADHPWYPASLTKLMTAYLVFETWKAGQAAPADKIIVSARANSRPKMRLGLGAGKSLTYADAMSALILLSANDIAVALAEAVSGSEQAFVEKMNVTATRLGMTSTHFINANGLPGEGQHTTARDLARLSNAVMRDFPEHAGLFALKMAPVATRTVATHNPVLLRINGGDGLKTGFTCSAGYNIVATATRDSTRIVAIVLGETTQAIREARTLALIEYGFRILEWKAIFPAATVDDFPVEPFELDQTREANLTKRYKDCLPPEAELDADGNPICPAMEVKSTRSGRAVAIAKIIGKQKQSRQLPEKCAQIALAAARAAPKKQSAAVLQAASAAHALRRKAIAAKVGSAARNNGSALP